MRDGRDLVGGWFSGGGECTMFCYVMLCYVAMSSGVWCM